MVAIADTKHGIMDRTMTNVDNFTAWINSELEAREWSIRELGKRAGLSATTISNVLNGHRMPGKRFCIALARAFGVSREEVFRHAGFLQPLPDNDAGAEQALYLFRRLTVADQERILVMMRALAELSEAEEK